MMIRLQLKTRHTVYIGPSTESNDIVVRCDEARVRCIRSSDAGSGDGDTITIKDCKQHIGGYHPATYYAKLCLFIALLHLVVNAFHAWYTYVLIVMLKGTTVSHDEASTEVSAPLAINYSDMLVWIAIGLVVTITCDICRLLLWRFRDAAHEHRIPGATQANINTISLGRRGHLVMTIGRLSLLSLLDIESCGGSMTFEQCPDHLLLPNPFLATIPPLSHVTFRLSDGARIDGANILYVDDLCIVCCCGNGSISGLTATRQLRIVSRSPISFCETSGHQRVMPSYYKVDVATLPQCVVNMAGSTTRSNIRLNGVLDPVIIGEGEEEEDVFMNHLLGHNST